MRSRKWNQHSCWPAKFTYPMARLLFATTNDYEERLKRTDHPNFPSNLNINLARPQFLQRKIENRFRREALSASSSEYRNVCDGAQQDLDASLRSLSSTLWVSAWVLIIRWKIDRVSDRSVSLLRAKFFAELYISSGKRIVTGWQVLAKLLTGR